MKSFEELHDNKWFDMGISLNRITKHDIYFNIRNTFLGANENGTSRHVVSTFYVCLWQELNDKKSK
jgi:hypothetical protein